MPIVHPIPPVYDKTSKILILGSFPSVKSRESAFFYGHAQNRFWRTLSELRHTALPETISDKKALLITHHIALWDVIASCEIKGSADSTIKNAVPNDLTPILQSCPQIKIFTNGCTADRYYRRFQEQKTGKAAICLPSTSAANAAYSLADLIEHWQVINEYL